MFIVRYDIGPDKYTESFNTLAEFVTWKQYHESHTPGFRYRSIIRELE